MKDSMDGNEGGELWPTDCATQALFAQLEVDAPQPSAAFSEQLYRRALAARTQRRSGSAVRRWLAGERAAHINGGIDVKRGVLALGMAVVLIAMLVVAAVPSARADVGDALAALRHLVLGDSTEVRQIEPLSGELPSGEYPWQMPAGTYWIVKTDVGTYGANVLPGEDDAVRTVQSLAEAEALAGARPLTPAELPDGYSLREVKVPPGPQPVFFQFYAGPGPDIVIVQTGVGKVAGESPDASEAVVVSTMTETVTEGTVEDVAFDGRPAAWIDGHTLKWEADGMTFDVGGLGLDLPTAMAIGRSLH
jgi:hypothetical protein